MFFEKFLNPRRTENIQCIGLEFSGQVVLSPAFQYSEPIFCSLIENSMAYASAS